MKTIIIIANGEPIHKALLKKLIMDADYIIAADGGINTCLKNNIEPDCLIGDLDSGTADISSFPNTEVIKIDEQYSTDLEKALNHALKMKPDYIKILSAFGRRTDHTLGNLFILQNAPKDIRMTMYDNNGFFERLLPGTHVIKNCKGQTLSLFVIAGIKNLRLEGFVYPLSKKKLGPAFLGVSNEIASDKAQIYFDDGVLLIYRVFQF